ncbi:MAG: exodeoxyribonuclease III [Acetobacteraceae bacterium]|nr:exodeoxyribonuclease III [Acetobacteraceae bacterium]
MKLATFNVNSARRRIGHVLRVLQRLSPDVLVLQELKCRTEEFPLMELQGSGYTAHVIGQTGGRNGVALLSRLPFEVTETALPGEAEDVQARFVAARIAGIELAGIYLPNGNSGGDEGIAYKWRFQDRLRDWAQAHLDAFRPVALLGDFNVCPTEADLAKGALPPGDALVHPESRARFRALLHQGFTDALRTLHPTDAPFTYWDYGPAFELNRGLRIDHALLSPELAERLVGCGVDLTSRAEESPSDHAPVWVELRD